MCAWVVLILLQQFIGKVEEEYIHSYCTEMLNAFMNEKDSKTPYAGILIWYLQTMTAALA